MINRPGMFERFKKEIDTGQYFTRLSAAENANFQAIYYLNRNSVRHVFHPELAEKEAADAAAELVKKWVQQQPASYAPQALPPVLRTVSRENQQAAQVSQAPTPDSTSCAPERQSTPMKKAALIAALEHEWPSIEADLGEATRNGLKDAAHTGKHGEWDREKARVWAVRKNKIKQAAPVHHLAKWPGTVTRNQS